MGLAAPVELSQDGLALAAHDLRSPVTNILGRLEQHDALAVMAAGAPVTLDQQALGRLDRHLAGAELSTRDLMLPHLGGAALIAALRADAAARGDAPPPIILMTAARLAQARAAGADAILRTPIHLSDLEALLHRFLGSPASSPD